MVISVVTTILRILIASIFLLYGIQKLITPQVMRVTLSRYLPARAIPVAAPLLPIAEIIVGLTVLFGLVMPGAAIAAGVMLVVFSALLIKGWIEESGKSDCGCSTYPMSIRVAVLRNAFLMIATLFVIFLPTGSTSLFLWLLEAGVATLIVGGVLLLARRQPVGRADVSSSAQAAGSHSTVVRQGLDSQNYLAPSAGTRFQFQTG